MGKLSKRYNTKARQGSLLSQDEEQKKNAEIAESIGVSSSDAEYKAPHDTSNAFVTVGKKTYIKDKSYALNKQKQSKQLTKKQKKKVAAMYARRQKEKNRGGILKSLSEHQATHEELLKFKPTVAIGQVLYGKRKDYESESCCIPSIVKTSRKRKKKNYRLEKRTLPDVISLPSINKNVESDSSDEDCNSKMDDAPSEKEDELHTLKEENNDKCMVSEEGADFVADSESQLSHCKDLSACLENVKDDKIYCDIDSLLKDNSKQCNSNFSESEISSTRLPKHETIKPIYVEVNRTKNVQTARLLLPILPEEQIVMETIQDYDIVIICGSTGSGKTTQVPQFLYEAGYGSHISRSGIIGVTEPRRVAAMSMSKRVAEEMSLPYTKVSYQIRYEGNTTKETAIKFMTDGVLLKEMESDFLLSKYSVIIIDEAHERSVYTDILIGLVSRVVPLRLKKGNALKLIIMSATLRVEDFTVNKCLFSKPPPILKIDSRQYPVTIHFNRKTNEDYVSEAFRKVCKIHQSFKVDGGILVFLTGQREVLSLCRKLQEAFPKKAKDSKVKPLFENDEVLLHKGDDSKSEFHKIDLDKYTTLSNICDGMDEADVGISESDFSEDESLIVNERNDKSLSLEMSDNAPLHILPLFSSLSTDEQSRVFSEPPEEHRLCVVATNVAETSLTIPGIKYIIDSGKVKKKFYDKVTGVSTFRICWTSKASANQRAGRAGRVGPGHCYRLYSSAVFENSFEEFSEPEICRRPVDDLVLQMKNMRIDKVLNFPFPTPPQQIALESAEKLLLELGALKMIKTKQGNQLPTISAIGKSLSKIPVSPRFAKMIYSVIKHKDCIQYIIVIAAALTVRDIFTDNIDLSQETEIEEEDARKKKIMITKARRKWAGDGPSSSLGDLMVILRAVGAAEHSGYSKIFCENNGLRQKAMLEIKKMRVQLEKTISVVFHDKNISFDEKLKPPSDGQALLIRQIVLSCMTDRVARKFPNAEAKLSKLKNAYQCCSTDDPVYIHPTSSLFSKLPEYIVYFEINDTSKLYMKTVFSISEDWLPLYASNKCQFGKPLDVPQPFYDPESGQMKCYLPSTFGHHVWPLPPKVLSFPNCADKYRWFSKYFLDGEIFAKLHVFSSHLLTPSSVMLKSWAHLQDKTEGLLCSFMKRNIDDKFKLLDIWKTNPKYILHQYLKWLPLSQHEGVKAIWPPA